MKNIGSFFAVLTILDGNAVAKFLIVLVIGQHQVAGNRCAAQLIRDSMHRFCRNIRIDSAQAFKHHIWQHYLPLIPASGSVGKCIRFFCHAVKDSIFMALMQRFYSGLFDHVFCYDFWHRVTSTGNILSDLQY